VEVERDLVDGLRVGALITLPSSTLQKSAIFCFTFFSSGCVARQRTMSGWMPKPGQLLHAVLRGLRLELAGAADERHQRQVHVEGVLAADLPAELPDRPR
jgi:hypothetical protein